MEQWTIRITEWREAASLLFVGQELIFADFVQAVHRVKEEGQQGTIRFEISEWKQHQQILIGSFGYPLDSPDAIEDAIRQRLEMGVKQGLIKKAHKAQLLKQMAEQLPVAPKKAKRKKKEKPPTPIVPKVATDVPIEKPVSAPRVRSTSSKKSKQAFAWIMLRQKFFGWVQIRPVLGKWKSWRKRWKWPTFSRRPAIPWRQVGKIGAFGGLAAVFAGLLALGWYVWSPEEQAKPSPSAEAETFLQKKQYQKAFQKDASAFWEWEEEQVQESDVRLLLDVYTEVPDPAIALDIAFLKQDYKQVITWYEQTDKQVTWTKARYAFVGYSYVQQGKLAQAEVLAPKSQSDALHQAIALAYFKKGDMVKARAWENKAPSEALAKKFEDWQLLVDTKKELQVQLQKKGLSETLKKTLRENITKVEQEIKKLQEEDSHEPENETY
ncbi:hypothetical protein EP56_01735 [Listeriaceae bacterium FSL A5-0209]|nr:hypothetical protein EP56_01735 [Listeriaceae bacterium FSL A5-0209]